MTEAANKLIGILVDAEADWPDAFVTAVNNHAAPVTAEMVKIGGTPMTEKCPYDLIVDRASHNIPYYRAYVKFAAISGSYIINNPFTWSADSKFFGAALIQKLGMKSPRTVALPNKDIAGEGNLTSFRNLTYPMDWDGLINYVGLPAIFKDILSGGRAAVFRVTNFDELLQRYDESGTRTMILQQIIDSDVHIHGFVVGQEKVMLLRYSLATGKYQPEIITEDDPLYQKLAESSLALTRAYRYDINMVEFVIKDDEPYVINSTNPVPVIDKELMSDEQFDWVVQEMAETAVLRAQSPLPQRAILKLPENL